MSSEQVIAPCPFCGGEASANSCRTSDKEYIRLNKRDTGYGVNCIACGVNNRGIAIGYATQDEAVAAWNRRWRTFSEERGADGQPTGYLLFDRLSTPAAGGDDEVSRWIAALTHAAEQNDTDLLPDGMRAIAELLGQLQARNAEQAARIERRTDALTAWQKRAEAAEAKHTALLDGIEGLDRWSPGYDHYPDDLDPQGDWVRYSDIAALRDLPAIGEKV